MIHEDQIAKAIRQWCAENAPEFSPSKVDDLVEAVTGDFRYGKED